MDSLSDAYKATFVERIVLVGKLTALDDTCGWISEFDRDLANKDNLPTYATGLTADGIVGPATIKWISEP
ncbi:hypothetical protein O9929_20185 [Vibrio lentus]|nr:hypothetical protein [Vibrio lentus]